MTETGWIIIVLVAVAAIILAFVILRRKGAATALHQEPVATDLIPEQIPSPVSKAEPQVQAQSQAGTSFPQEPLASIVPPIAEVLATAPPPPAPPAAPTPTPVDEVPVPIDLSAALDDNTAAEPAKAEAITISAPPTPAAVVAATTGEGDNLLRLKGVGPKIATLLKSEGITRYAQIAAWDDADITAIDAKLGSFAGRPRRDNWVDQATFLAAGDTAGYEAKYGKL